jgi:hypothetical protein
VTHRSNEAVLVIVWLTGEWSPHQRPLPFTGSGPERLISRTTKVHFRSEPNPETSELAGDRGFNAQYSGWRACPQGNSHLGNHAEFLPFHTHEFATLEIDTNSVTIQDRKATATVAFLVL